MPMGWTSIKSRFLSIRKLYRKKLGSKYSKSSLLSDDSRYKKRFLNHIGPEIYKKHLNSYFICCSFCSHLIKSTYHEYFFSCSKNVYSDCGLLLPGTYEHVCDQTDHSGEDVTPWIFKTPCTNFERLDASKYFKHFLSKRHSITVSNFEALEGIFFGKIRGKRPCHICASVNLEIYNNCTSHEKIKEESSCGRILSEISTRYSAILGMIKYCD